MRFEQVIRDAASPKAASSRSRRRTILRRQIALSVAGDVPVPAVAVAALNQYQNEQRSIDYLALGAAQAVTFRRRLRASSRKFRRAQSPVPRAGIPQGHRAFALARRHRQAGRGQRRRRQDLLEQHMAQYGTPEKRELRQIVYPNAEEAKGPRASA